MILSTSCVSGIRTTTKAIVFPVLRFALCSMRFAIRLLEAIIGKYARILQLGENHELDSFRS